MKSFEEVEDLIWTNPDELDEPEIERYLRFAEEQAALDRDNYLALIALDGPLEKSAA